MKETIKNKLGAVLRRLLEATQLRSLIREEVDAAIVRQLSNIDVGLRLRAILASADFVYRHIPLHKRYDHTTLRKIALDTAPSEGLLMEFGVCHGNWIRQFAAWTSRPIYGFDTFEGIPEPWWAYDAGSMNPGGLPPVPAHVHLIKGLFADTLPVFLQEHADPVAFIHMDCDLYRSTRTVLELLRDRLQPGTTLVLDDFMAEPGWQDQETRAFLEFVQRHNLGFEYIGYSIGTPSCSAAVRFTRV